jgi:hypothetical protein
MKRLFIIIAGVVVLIGILVGLYFFFFSSNDAGLTVGNPFSGIGSGNVSPSSDLPTEGTLRNAGTEIAPRFIKITDGPVARGTIAFAVQVPSREVVTTGTTSTSTPATVPDVEARFIDRASGNVYSYVAHARTLTRISNKTLPGVQRASWTPDGSRAFAQFISSAAGEERINTYSMAAQGGEGFLLESNLAETKAAGSSTLFTLLSGANGSVGTLSNIDGSNSRTLFSSVLSALTVHTSNSSFFATNKPSSEIDGYAFQINRSSGGFSRILGPFRGLSVLPSTDGSSLLYSYTEAGSYRLRVVTLSTRSSVALPVATLTEKCVWAANGLSIYCAVPTNLQGNLPDNWYQGVTVFTDRIWRIDLTERVASLVLDPGQVGEVAVDAVNLTLDPGEDILFFTDKHSGALYAYDL